jgi:phosphate transport system protein
MMERSNRGNLDRQLHDLETSLLDLSSMVEKAVSYAVAALKNRDYRLAQQVITTDRTLNERRYQIENEALSLLALQQPVVSRDLRYIAAVMHIAGELERMGDYAKGVARISDKLPGSPPVAIMLKLEEMGKIANRMLHSAMDAFIDHSASKATMVASEDDELDELYNQSYRELLQMMFADNSQVDLATLLLWAAHNMERVGDRVTNICERIVFVETGVMGDSPGHHSNIATQ